MHVSLVFSSLGCVQKAHRFRFTAILLEIKVKITYTWTRAVLKQIHEILGVNSKFYPLNINHINFIDFCFKFVK